MTEEKQEEKEIIIGEFKPKRKFLNFVSASNRARVRYIRDIAFLKGEQLSGVLEGIVFKITICDEGTINFEEVDTNETDKAQLQRLLDDIDSMDVTGYAQKFVVGSLEFNDVNGDRCYLEVEHQKPIDKLASLLDMFEEEKKEVEETTSTLSDKGMSILDSLFGDDTEIPESNEDLGLTEKDIETIIEANENPPEPNEKLKNAATSYMEEQFRKMNEDKVKELKERISKKLEDVIKYNRDKSFAETKLEQTKEELSVLETRLESMTPGDDPNGFAFYVSEEQKSDTGLDESTRHVADKIAELMKLKKDVLFDHLTSGYYTIKIAPKDDFENVEDIEKDILSKVASIDVLGNISMTENGTFEYRGELNWHQLVQKMIRNGFEQVPEFDEFCNSNSYESHEEDKNLPGIDLGTGVGTGHPDDYESEFDKDEEFMFAIYEDLTASNQLGEPQAMIQICPKSYWLSEGYAYDQHTEHELRMRYPYLKSLGHQLEELCESSTRDIFYRPGSC